MEESADSELNVIFLLAPGAKSARCKTLKLLYEHIYHMHRLHQTCIKRLQTISLSDWLSSCKLANHYIVSA